MIKNDIKFIRGDGGLGRPLPNKDHVGAICLPILDADLPSGFTVDDRIKKVFSISEVEALGILNNVAATAFAHYQISEAFRINGRMELYIYLYDSTATTADVYLEPVIMFPQDGEIRQAAVFIAQTLTAAITLNVGTVVTAMDEAHRPFEAILGFSGFEAGNDWANAVDLRASDVTGVSVVIGCDADGLGADLSTGVNDNVPAIGAVLGAVSLASVHESIMWVDKFNLSDGTELEKAAIGHKSDLINLIPDTLKDNLLEKGYLFFIKRIGISGTYAIDSPSISIATSDYTDIESRRTINKAIRNIRANLLPRIGSSLYLNPDGTLREDTVQSFRVTAEKPLDVMAQNGEISAHEITINPNQPILQTSKLEIGGKIVKVGVARAIEFKIGFTLNVSS